MTYVNPDLQTPNGIAKWGQRQDGAYFVTHDDNRTFIFRTAEEQKGYMRRWDGSGQTEEDVERLRADAREQRVNDAYFEGHQAGYAEGYQDALAELTLLG